jgi:excisionase family DNA binding protein
MLTIKEAAEHFSVHPNTIRNWIKAGNIQVIRLSARTFRIELAELERMKGTK